MTVFPTTHTRVRERVTSRPNADILQRDSWRVGNRKNYTGLRVTGELVNPVYGAGTMLPASLSFMLTMYMC